MMSQPRFETLVTRYLTDKLSEMERAEFEQWLAASPEHRRLFTETEAIWNAARPPVLESPTDLNHAWQELEERLELSDPGHRMLSVPAKPPRPVARRRSFWSYHALGIAALFLLVFAGLFFAHRYHQLSPRRQDAWHEVMTANGERHPVTLPDGSIVQLNAASHLTYQPAFSDSIRFVRLEGEAFFSVVSDGRPFVVQTSDTKVRVLGTAFDIWTRGDHTRVIVKEGRVAVWALATPHEPAIVVTANQMTLHRAQRAVEPPRPVDADYLLGWLRGVLVFDHTPLSELVAELQRVYDATIIVTDPALRARRITGSFSEQSLDVVLSALCLTLEAQYRRQANTYYISRK